MRTFICIILAALGRGMSEKRVQFKLAATVAYEAVPSRAEALSRARSLADVPASRRSTGRACVSSYARPRA